MFSRITRFASVGPTHPTKIRFTACGWYWGSRQVWITFVPVHDDRSRTKAAEAATRESELIGRGL